MTETTGTSEFAGRTPDDISWTLLAVEECVEAYWHVLAPAFEADGYDPHVERPTHEWLRTNGFRPLLYALREYHDRTFEEFWTDDVGLAVEDDRTTWATDDEQTAEALTSFLTSRRKRKGLAESSLDTLRYRLNRYVGAYRAENETDDLLAPVARGGDVPAHEAVDACWAAFDRLHRELDGGQTKRRIHLAVSNWYAHLVRRKWATVNPADGLDDEFDWSNGSDAERTGDTPCLTADHVRSLYTAAEDAEERLLVLALCAWGLRPNEVARLDITQFVLDTDDVPYIEFDERKNGPGQVSLLYGREELEAYVDSRASDDDWQGYLFSSPHASRDHVSRWTVWKRFERLSERAGVPERIDGVSTSPKLGRRFWYDAYSSSLDVVLGSLDEIAAEQGSSSADVVLHNYLSESRARELRRTHMRDRLEAAFEAG
ncbi:tyrosine-type recombinase/integrase [Halogeometricum limi]|uniref:Site-specific recombinase XerC n=1 Tax=Halogeometricum limi TaxID=555875 RepID=A0A1I6ICM7_9EURY|nr:tyrosine-type recombinase/integrase [Halogeometricum limi]SFR64436.1 Site-specific recombinase XerC [Halogeometricum limi]